MLSLAVRAGLYPSEAAALADARAAPPMPEGCSAALRGIADALGDAREHFMFLAGATGDCGVTDAAPQ